MKKHLKEQFSNWTMPLMVILVTLVAYFTTNDIFHAIAYLMQSLAITLALYLYGALCAYETELETRKEYEPEEPEV